MGGVRTLPKASLPPLGPGPALSAFSRSSTYPIPLTIGAGPYHVTLARRPRRRSISASFEGGEFSARTMIAVAPNHGPATRFPLDVFQKQIPDCAYQILLFLIKKFFYSTW